MTKYPASVRLYVVLVVGSAVAVGVSSLMLGRNSAGLTLLLLVALSFIAEATKVLDRDDRQTVSVAAIVSLGAIPLVGIAGAMLVGSIGCLFSVRRLGAFVSAFNAGVFALMTGLGALTYTVAGGSFDVYRLDTPSEVAWQLLLPLLAASVVQCFVNAALLAGVISLDNSPRWSQVFVGMLRQGAVTYVGYGLFGLLLAVLWGPAGVGPLSALLALAPLYVARWAWSQFAEEQRAYERTVRTLVAAVEKKDLYTRGHSERVARACSMIAKVMRMDEQRAQVLSFAGILHDVGKLGVPTRVLQKNGPLTDAEFDTIALHPVRGLEMVRDIEFLGEAFDGILHHHERLDGRGYPMGLAGERIPEFARIIAVADAFDSMTSTRSYRSARSVEQAIAELHRCTGDQFDERFVRALVHALEGETWDPVAAPVEDAPAGTPELDHDDPGHARPRRQGATS